MQFTQAMKAFCKTIVNATDGVKCLTLSHLKKKLWIRGNNYLKVYIYSKRITFVGLLSQKFIFAIYYTVCSKLQTITDE